MAVFPLLAVFLANVELMSAQKPSPQLSVFVIVFFVPWKGPAHEGQSELAQSSYIPMFTSPWHKPSPSNSERIFKYSAGHLEPQRFISLFSEGYEQFN